MTAPMAVSVTVGVPATLLGSGVCDRLMIVVVPVVVPVGM